MEQNKYLNATSKCALWWSCRFPGLGPWEPQCQFVWSFSCCPWTSTDRTSLSESIEGLIRMVASRFLTPPSLGLVSSKLRKDWSRLLGSSNETGFIYNLFSVNFQEFSNVIQQWYSSAFQFHTEQLWVFPFAPEVGKLSHFRDLGPLTIV